MDTGGERKSPAAVDHLGRRRRKLLGAIPAVALGAGVPQTDPTLLVGGCLIVGFLHRRVICRWIVITGMFFDGHIALERSGSEMFW
jgi:hypothetical protein